MDDGLMDRMIEAAARALYEQERRRCVLLRKSVEPWEECAAIYRVDATAALIAAMEVPSKADGEG